MTLVAISVDERADSERLAAKLGVQFPLLADPGLGTALAYGVAMKGDDIAVPSVFVVGKDSKIHYRYVGESIMDRPSAEKILEMAKQVKN